MHDRGTQKKKKEENKNVREVTASVEKLVIFLFYHFLFFFFEIQYTGIKVYVLNQITNKGIGSTRFLVGF